MISRGKDRKKKIQAQLNARFTVKDGNLLSQSALTLVRVVSHSWYSAVSLSVLYIMAGWLGAKFLIALLIFIVASRRRSKATEQEIHGRNKHHLLPLTGNLTECIRGGMNPSWESVPKCWAPDISKIEESGEDEQCEPGVRLKDIS